MAGLIRIANLHDGRIYYASVVDRRKRMVVHKPVRLDEGEIDFGPITFNLRYEAAIWDHPPSLFSRPLLIINMDAGHRPHIGKDQFSLLIISAIRDERLKI